MDVVILTEGGKVGGLGHIARCSSIFQAFQERGITPRLLVHADDHVKKFLEGNNYQRCNWLKERNKCFEFIKKAEIVIVDSYLADIGFYKKLSKRVRVPVYIDDNKRLDYPRGVVINGGIHAQILKYPQKEDVVYFLGTRYALLRSLFWQIIPKKTRNTIKRMMVTTGGNDPMNLMPKIIKLLKVRYPTLKKHIIIGSTFRNIDRIKNESDKTTQMVYSPDANEMAATMLQSDIAISSGGQTLYELARLGVPTIAFCQAENQRLNLEGWNKEGFVEYVRRLDDLEKGIIRGLNKLLSKEERTRRRDIGMKLVDGQGAKRIVEGLLGYEN